MTKTFVPMKVKMGTDQRAVYQFHAQNKPEQSTAGEEMGRLAAVGCQVNLLRQAALCPDSHSLTKFHRDLGGRGMLRSRSIHTPKLAATMQLIGDCLHDGEQVVLFSPFQHFNDTILGILRRSCVSAVLLDGKTNEQERGRQAGRFKNKEYSVLLAGLKSMSEGHSFDQCCRLILPTLEWAFDLNAQAVERVHRVNSKKPVTIYTLVTEGTIDIRLTNLFEEKGDAADLALDGQLFERATEEINLGDLLREAIKDFDPAEPTVDEADIAQQWPQQQAYLNAGEKHFRSLYPATMPLTSLPQPRTPKAPAGIPNSDIADQVMNQLELLLAG